MTEEEATSPLRRATFALKAEIGRQLGSAPLFGDASTGDWFAESKGGSLDLTACARAVIAAIREPSQEMVDDGDNSLEWDSSDINGSWYVRYSEGDAVKSWTAMIDSILATP